MQYSVKKSELEECYEQGMILQLEEDECLVLKSEYVREIIRVVIWKIAEDEGGQILHYNEWVDDNWKKLITLQPTSEKINKMEVKNE